MSGLKDEAYTGSPGGALIDKCRNDLDIELLHDGIVKMTEENERLRSMISRLQSALEVVLESQRIMMIELE